MSFTHLPDIWRRDRCSRASWMEGKAAFSKFPRISRYEVFKLSRITNPVITCIPVAYYTWGELDIQSVLKRRYLQSYPVGVKKATGVFSFRRFTRISFATHGIYYAGYGPDHHHWLNQVFAPASTQMQTRQLMQRRDFSTFCVKSRLLYRGTH